MGQNNRIKELEDKVKEQKDLIAILYNQLDEKTNHTYIGETHTIHCCDGEIYFGYGDVDEEKTLVMNVDELYKDLPSIIRMVIKEQKNTQAMHLEMIKEALS